MNYQHKSLASGRWKEMPFIEQMANIGSEIERALNWRAKDNAEYSQAAFVRGLELIGLTIEGAKGFARLKELTRLKESLLDYFLGTNEYQSSEESVRKYFMHFIFVARKDY